MGFKKSSKSLNTSSNLSSFKDRYEFVELEFLYFAYQKVRLCIIHIKTTNSINKHIYIYIYIYMIEMGRGGGVKKRLRVSCGGIEKWVKAAVVIQFDQVCVWER